MSEKRRIVVRNAVSQAELGAPAPMRFRHFSETPVYRQLDVEHPNFRLARRRLQPLARTRRVRYDEVNSATNRICVIWAGRFEDRRGAA